MRSATQLLEFLYRLAADGKLDEMSPKRLMLQAFAGSLTSETMRFISSSLPSAANSVKELKSWVCGAH